MQINESNLNRQEVEDYINLSALRESAKYFRDNRPFSHCVVDNFFKKDLAYQLEREFPEIDDPIWHEYNNPIEIKKVQNNWNLFPPTTYRVFSDLNSPGFIQLISEILDLPKLHGDPGLNGGGWHIHRKGGKLNTHLDYSIHPKLGLQRKLNLIIYLNSSWQEEWGGHLGLWEHNAERMQPGSLAKSVLPKFNRAVLFDTTQNSWHGLPQPLTSPKGQCRKSLAIYYLKEPPAKVDPRGKALFAPTDDQKDDPVILDLIAKRADINTARDVWKD